MKFEDRVQLKLSDLTEDYLRKLLPMGFVRHPEWVAGVRDYKH